MSLKNIKHEHLGQININDITKASTTLLLKSDSGQIAAMAHGFTGNQNHGYTL